MRKIILIALILITGFEFAFAKGNEKESEVTFLGSPPVVDGILDSELINLTIRTFNKTWKSDNNNSDINISYRLAYGTSFLYLFIEVETDRIICRDRGAQFGDGFNLVLAIPKYGGEPTDEFYVLAFNPQKYEESEELIGKKYIDYYNIDCVHRNLYETEFDFKKSNDKVCYEVLLPWQEVYPYHPWLSEGIGFNLCFVKAFGQNDYSYIYALYDKKVMWENSKRLYTILYFQKPQLEDGLQTHAIIDRNISKGKAFSARFATCSANSGVEKIEISIKNQPEASGLSEIQESQTLSLKYEKGLTFNTVDFDTDKLEYDDYIFSWESIISKSKGEIDFTLLPAFNYNLLCSQLEKSLDKISQGSFSAIKFKLDNLNIDINNLKAYETAVGIGKQISDLADIIEKGNNGDDAFAKKRGIFRRAFRSKIDDTLQPYSIEIPEDYNSEKKYPLFVYLHGSACDDRHLIHYQKAFELNDIILLTLFARGESHYYTPKNSREDIMEAINDVIENYSIDTDNIILGGFSMGGYGAYYTYYESPEIFKALAVFSGDPAGCNKFLMVFSKRFRLTTSPNFLKKRYLKSLTNIPIFIFHGKDDRSCPFERTEQFVEILKAAGAKVELHAEEGKGHESPSDETIKKFNK
ncbi:prolyl oligopeptidase family serine peptidase [bacterium]|nr:prolyl oligopeptidase family serine peptidase [bacterium]